MKDLHEDWWVTGHASQFGGSTRELGRSRAMAGVFRYLLEVDLLRGAQIGSDDAEAEEVVQQTVITVAKNVDKLKYDPAIGSFKGWLLQITRWRIADQFRKREPGDAECARSSDDRATATIERVPDSRIVDLDALWETEWKRIYSKPQSRA